ncbi:uncharacterized protein VTP21DRAFT_582 [Calcarisporiella thermophila]|uniref:uncharacterized protein n=1 Tax=Calcarisporiella thermophila TaxID=911321 RepID=UPI0037423FAF
MPKSKRSKVVTLSKTEKKGREGKEALFQQIRDAVDNFAYIWMFSVENMRNTYLKDVRTEWKTSRFFFGRTKVMSKALGTTPEEEYRENLRTLAEKMIGEVGLLFTNTPPEEVIQYFEAFRQKDYARAGFVATATVTIPAGTVLRGEDPFPHNMEPQLRALGMPTILKNGVVTLPTEYTICKVGDVLTPNQAHLLKHFYVQMAEFQVKLSCYWYKGELHEV